MTSAPARPAIRLQSGDRMTRHEFHRRYGQLPEIRAELIEGVVYVASPLKREHGRPHALVVGWLTQFWEQHPEVELLDNATVFLDVDNEVQPDASLRYLAGQSAVTQEDYVDGAPELVMEIAVSSVSIDLHDKLVVVQSQSLPAEIALLPGRTKLIIASPPSHRGFSSHCSTDKFVRMVSL